MKHFNTLYLYLIISVKIETLGFTYLGCCLQYIHRLWEADISIINVRPWFCFLKANFYFCVVLLLCLLQEGQSACLKSVWVLMRKWETGEIKILMDFRYFHLYMYPVTPTYITYFSYNCALSCFSVSLIGKSAKTNILITFSCLWPKLDSLNTHDKNILIQVQTHTHTTTTTTPFCFTCNSSYIKLSNDLSSRPNC